MPDALQLFEEYASAYARGERPQAREFLARAGLDADELATMIERFLVTAPVPAADASALAIVEAWAAQEPPLVALRASRGIPVDDVVDAILAAAAIAPGKRAKVKRYYQQLEGGLLDPRQVSERVWSAVRRLVGVDAETAAAWGPPSRLAAAPSYFRGEPALAREATSAATGAGAEEHDEVDELFHSGR